MPKTNLFLLIILLSIQSCNQRIIEKSPFSIIGDWNYVRTEYQIVNGDSIFFYEPTSWSKESNTGFILYSDSICENKNGYYKWISQEYRLNFLNIEKDSNSKSFSPYCKSFGHYSRFRIIEDSLKIYNPIDSSWNSRVIYSLTADSLVLQKDDTTFIIYGRAKPFIETGQNIEFDQIIVSSSPCFGFCPTMNISINKNGEIYYYGAEYNSINGVYKSKINPSNYQEIELRFKKADIGKLNELYLPNFEETPTVSVSFIKENKIFKTISDKGHMSPKEFQWAYIPLLFLYQEIPLTTFRNNNFYFGYYFQFKRNENYYFLSSSEGFYLWTLIMNGLKTKREICPFNFLKFNLETSNKASFYCIESDGQLFKIFHKNGVIENIDIRSNFIYQNNLENKFKPI